MLHFGALTSIIERLKRDSFRVGQPAVEVLRSSDRVLVVRIPPTVLITYSYHMTNMLSVQPAYQAVLESAVVQGGITFDFSTLSNLNIAHATGTTINAIN